MSCIHRLNAREGKALDGATMSFHKLPIPSVRKKLRAWFRQRWDYLIQEHEKLVP